jgi:RNA:NAD 2'-phosphotransferase (TPT1/KptA family)
MKNKTIGSGSEEKSVMQFPSHCKSTGKNKCERCVKVFNSSVEKRVEKDVSKMKSLVLRVACAHCTIVVQLGSRN